MSHHAALTKKQKTLKDKVINSFLLFSTNKEIRKQKKFERSVDPSSGWSLSFYQLTKRAHINPVYL